MSFIQTDSLPNIPSQVPSGILRQSLPLFGTGSGQTKPIRTDKETLDPTLSSVWKDNRIPKRDDL